MCICRGVAPYYAVDSSVPILDHGRNLKRKGDRLLNHVQYTCIALIIILNILVDLLLVHLHFSLCLNKKHLNSVEKSKLNILTLVVSFSVQQFLKVKKVKCMIF